MTTESPPAMVPASAARSRRLHEHLRAPLHRNAYALVASTFATSGLGALYWAIAAHHYSSHVVGINSSLITTMMFLTNLASLNFTDVLNRFVPVSGKKATRLVWGSYAIAVGLGGVSATVFVLGLSWWEPRLRETLHGPLLGVIYIAATMLWVVFVLQDAVLIAVRRAFYVLAENTTFGIVKIMLLVALAAALPTSGIFLSWTIPLLAVVLVVNFSVFTRFLPKHAADVTANVEDINRRHLSRFIAADYVASMVWTATIALMPLLTLSRVDASHSAYVYLSWTIAYTLYLVSRNMGMSLTTEGARDPARLAEHTRAMLLSEGRIIVPGALLLAAAAPWILDVFGAEYSAHATALLRLLALSAIPAIVPVTFVSVARVQRRLRAMVVVSVASTVPVVVMVPFLLSSMGITGVGVAWLVVQSAVALALLGGELRPHWRPAPATALVGAGAAPVIEPVTPLRVSEPVVVVAPEPKGKEPKAPRSRRRGLPAWWPLLTLGGAIGLWVDSLARLNPDAIGKLGLLSAAPITYYIALAVVTIGVAIALQRGAPMRIVLAHAAVFIFIVHATPAIAYGTLRYAWAWKHVGIVDLLQRTHRLTPSSPVLPIYMSWPGFFAASTTLTESAGLKSALSFASWAPAFFEMLNTLALVVVLRAFTDDRRRIALAVWFFLIANWVGQDYFAPQAFGYFLYLVVLAIVLHWYRRPPTDRRRFQPRFSLRGEEPDQEVVAAPPAGSRRAIAVLLLVIVGAMASSHPLTPFVLSVAMMLLWFGRSLNRRWPVFAVVGITGAWMASGAHAYVYTQGLQIAQQFGQLGSNVDSNISNVGKMSQAQQLVANMGRLVVVGMAVLAVAGFLRRAFNARWDFDVVLLCAAPAAIFVGGSYGGEAVFRVYLFALPFAAFLAAGLFFATPSAVTKWRTPVAITLVSAVLLGGFMFGYYGKEQWFRFSPSEVRAAELVFSTAPKNSNIVDGTREYPTQFKNQERFTYTALVNEPPQSLQSVLNDPVTTLHSWLSDPKYAQSYIIITRSQIKEADDTGQMPKGALARIEAELLASGQFDVLYHDRDAVVFTLGPTTTATATATAVAGVTP